MSAWEDLRPAIADLHRAGLPAIPMCAPHQNGGCSVLWHRHGLPQIGKVPMVPGFQILADQLPALHMLERGCFVRFGRTSINLAIVVPRGMVVVEADSPEADAELEALIGPVQTPIRAARPGRGRAWLLSLRDMPPGMEVRSRVGLGASGAIDVRAAGALLIVPPSVHATGHVYTWEQPPLVTAVCPPGLLDLIVRRGSEPGSVTEAKSRPAPGGGRSCNTDGRPADEVLPSREERLDRAQGYLATMAPSWEGLNGSRDLYLAAATLTRGFCLMQDDAMTLLREHFNPRCRPPWSEAELLRKVVEASYARVMPWTWLMPGIGFDQGSAEVRPPAPGGGRPSCSVVVPAAPVASAPRTAGHNDETHWPTSSPVEYASVVISRWELRANEIFIGFTRETDADRRPLGALVLDHPLSEDAMPRAVALRRALGIPEGADLTRIGGKRLRIEYLHNVRRVGRVYPPIADNQARWQSLALGVVREQLPSTDPLRLKIERALAKRNVPWGDRDIRAWWAQHRPENGDTVTVSMQARPVHAEPRS